MRVSVVWSSGSPSSGGTAQKCRVRSVQLLLVSESSMRWHRIRGVISSVRLSVREPARHVERGRDAAVNRMRLASSGRRGNRGAATSAHARDRPVQRRARGRARRVGHRRERLGNVRFFAEKHEHRVASGRHVQTRGQAGVRGPPSRFRAIAALNVHAAAHALLHAATHARLSADDEAALRRVARSVALAAVGESTKVHYTDVADGMERAASQLPQSCDGIYANVTSAALHDAPLSFPAVVCSAPAAPAEPPQDLAGHLPVLKALCERQFSFGRSEPNEDALGLPDFAKPLQPNVKLWFSEVGINATTLWSGKSDFYVGLRFGVYMFYLVPATLLAGMLVMDAVLVVLWNTSTATRVRPQRWSLLQQSALEVYAEVRKNEQVAVRSRFQLAAFQLAGLAAVSRPRSWATCSPSEGTARSSLGPTAAPTAAGGSRTGPTSRTSSSRSGCWARPS